MFARCSGKATILQSWRQRMSLSDSQLPDHGQRARLGAGWPGRRSALPRSSVCTRSMRRMKLSDRLPRKRSPRGKCSFVCARQCVTCSFSQMSKRIPRSWRQSTGTLASRSPICIVSQETRRPASRSSLLGVRAPHIRSTSTAPPTYCNSRVAKSGGFGHPARVPFGQRGRTHALI